MNSIPPKLMLLMIWPAVCASYAADLTGRVVLTGKPPPETRIDLSFHPDLVQKYPNGLTTRRYEVSADGGLQNVLVYLRGNFTGASFEPPKAPALVSHRDGRFETQIMGVQAGQPLALRYSDNCAIQADAKINKGFIFVLKESYTFTQPEVGIRLRCDGHLWNSAYLGVFSHPYFAVTDKDGKFTIQGVPSGNYTLEVFHPKAGIVGREISVADGETKIPDLTMKPK